MIHPVAITGMHRSGTSMITRALHDSGLHLVGTGAEDLLDPAEDNPEGFWENKAIVAANEDLLEACGGSWDNPPDLPPQSVDDPRVAHVADAASAALDGLREHEQWGFKDPRACLTAAYWLDLEPELRFIICVRHPLEVALSLKRRNQNSYSLGLALWERYYATVLDQVPAERRIVTHYDTFFVDPEGEAARLCAFAGLVPAPPSVRSDLRHHTIDVDLGDAGASRSLRALYADLCRTAGAPPPRDTTADEGRVRRLILDGAVAQRHADQRQDAIDRLEEREVQFRAEHTSAQEELRQRMRDLERQRAALEAEHRSTVRDLERQRTRELERQRAALEAAHRSTVRDLERELASTRQEAVARLAALQQETSTALGELQTSLARIDQRTAATASRLEVVVAAVEPTPLRRALRRASARAVRGGRRYLAPGRRVLSRGQQALAPAARTAAHKLPPPAQDTLRRGRVVLKRGVDQPAPTAKAVGRKAVHSARLQVHHLPPPAQQALRRGRTLYRRTAAAPVPTAQAAARRLPVPLQRALRRGWAGVLSVQRAAGPEAIVPEPAPKPPPTPKGPAPRLWKEAYEQMVRAAWSDDDRWLVVGPGSPKEARDVRTPRAAAFPDSRDGRPFADDLAHVAQLEVLRYEGHRHLVLPEGSRPWFLQQVELRDHIVRSYRTVVDQAGAGAVFDLWSDAADGSETLRSAVERLTPASTSAPSVLDWSGLGLASELPDLATFAPPVGELLPYIDDSVDVVVVGPTRDVVEARRVAVAGVIAVVAGPTGPEVRSIDRLAPSSDAAAPEVVVWSTEGTDPRWRAALAGRAASAGATVRFGPLDAAGLATVTDSDSDIVIAVEPHVLPLPGALEAAALLVATHPDRALTGKVLRSDGRLESAGGAVFFDRSVALIAEGSPDVRAPWHEYVRTVCWAPGLLAAAAEVWRTVPAPPIVEGRPFLREWCANAWAHGTSVVYQPAVAAARVEGDGGEPTTPMLSSAWQRVLDLRPARPRELSDGAWRFLLAHDDVEACRG